MLDGRKVISNLARNIVFPISGLMLASQGSKELKVEWHKVC